MREPLTLKANMERLMGYEEQEQEAEATYSLFSAFACYRIVLAGLELQRGRQTGIIQGSNVSGGVSYVYCGKDSAAQ